MDRIAVFPGSFDPVTRGHESIIHRALPLFDRMIVAIGENSTKKSYFPLSQRVQWLQTLFANEPKITILTYRGLTVDLCRREKAGFILRGLRSATDFEFERGIGQMNRIMRPEIETVFLLTLPEYTPVNSSIVREIIKSGGDVSAFVPKGIRIMRPADPEPSQGRELQQ